MCDPFSLATDTISAGSAVVGHIAQDKQKKANDAAARDAFVTQIRDLNARQLEEELATQSQIQAAQRQTRGAIATAQVSAAEAGVAGQSAQAVVQNAQRQGADYTDSANANLSRTLMQIDRLKMGANSQEQGRINSVQGGNIFATGLQIAGAGLSAYNGYLRTPRPPKGT
jgi:hypothetical protein